MGNYNIKAFLSPNSEWSMSCFHAKIHADGIAQFRIHDCNQGIKIWNDLNEIGQTKEMVEKLLTLSDAAKEFAEFIKQNYS